MTHIPATPAPQAAPSDGGEALKSMIDKGLTAIAQIAPVSPAMKTWPEEIYLSTGEDDELAPFGEYSEVSWCDHPTNSVDVRYVREDVVARAAAWRAAAVPLTQAADQSTAAVVEYKTGKWFDARTIDEMEAFYLSRLPAIREAAREHGYAIGVHGSVRRDFDLLAMPWREDAADRDTLARAIADAACGIRREGAYDWEQKPAGRVATSIPICWTAHDNPDFDNMISAGHIDLSLRAATPAAPLAQEREPVVMPFTASELLKLWAKAEESSTPTFPALFQYTKEVVRLAALYTGPPPAVPLPAQQASESADPWEFIADVSGQKPEKPDYWSSCGQCDNNIERARDLIDDRAAMGDARKGGEHG